MKTIRFNLSNPIFIYSMIWTGVLFLVNLRFVNFIQPLNLDILLLVLGNIYSFILVYIPLSYLFPKQKENNVIPVSQNTLDILLHYSKKLMTIWCFGIIITIIHAKGFPLLWIVIKYTAQDYRHFGISTFNGFLNAIYLFSITSLYLVYCIRKDKKLLKKIILLLLIPFLLVSRGLFVWAILQMFGIYLLIHRLSYKRLLNMVILIILFIIIFGWIGDMRLGENKGYMFNLLNTQYKKLFSYLPSGFIWVYTYITCGVNNVNGVIQHLSPLYTPYFTTISLVPTIIRNILYKNATYALKLVNPAFTSSTFYAGYLADFGVYGAFFIVALLQFIIVYFYLSARRYKIWGMIAYAVLFQALVLSIFWDTFTSLVTIMQLLFALYFKQISKKYSYRKQLY